MRVYTRSNVSGDADLLALADACTIPIVEPGDARDRLVGDDDL